jgi:hypothetical protein
MTPSCLGRRGRPNAAVVVDYASCDTIRFVQKTTVYLPADLKRAVERAASVAGVSEAEVIRTSIRVGVESFRGRPAARALFHSDEQLSSRVDELLPGFGEG